MSCILYLVSCVLCLVPYVLYLVSYVLCLMSCVLYLHVSCVFMYIVSCVFMYRVSCIFMCLVSCILYLMTCVLCLVPYVLCLVSSCVLCLHVSCVFMYLVSCILYLRVSCILCLHVSCIMYLVSCILHHVSLCLASCVTLFSCRYRGLWEYLDGTVAYFARLEYHALITTRACGRLLERRETMNQMGDVACTEKFLARYLCERADKKSPQAEAIQFPDPPASGSFPTGMTSCPAGHVVHSFLACDVASVCWARVDDDGEGFVLNALSADAAAAAARGASGSTSGSGWCAGAGLTPLPPSFPCRRGADRVPYSLVCDHRPDCADRSDEDFCHFPPCTLDHFHCGNGEVSG